MDFTRICAAFIVVAVTCVILKNFGYKGAGVFTSFAILVFLSCFMEKINVIKDCYFKMFSYPKIENYAKIALKIVGIGYLSGISSDVCKELGECGVAKCIGVLAKLELACIVTPLIGEILKTAEELIGA